jgi:hypothetical protein
MPVCSGHPVCQASAVVTPFSSPNCPSARMRVTQKLPPRGQICREQGQHDFCCGLAEADLIFQWIGMVEYIPCYSALAVHWGLLPGTRLAGRKILIEQNIKKRTGPALCVLGGCTLPSWVRLASYAGCYMYRAPAVMHRTGYRHYCAYPVSYLFAWLLSPTENRCFDFIYVFIRNPRKTYNSPRHLESQEKLHTLLLSLKGTISWDFLASVFFMDLLYMASDFEAKRIFFSFTFSRSYSNISMNPRFRLLRGFKNIFLRIPKLMEKFGRYQVQLFTTLMIFKLLSLSPGRQSFKVWHLNPRSSHWITAIGYCGECQ